MSDTNKYPPGWSRQRVDNLLAHYEGQSEEDTVLEDESMLDNRDITTMGIPRQLVPRVRELIAEHEDKTGT